MAIRQAAGLILMELVARLLNAVWRASLLLGNRMRSSGGQPWAPLALVDHVNYDRVSIAHRNGESQLTKHSAPSADSAQPKRRPRRYWHSSMRRTGRQLKIGRAIVRLFIRFKSACLFFLSSDFYWKWSIFNTINKISREILKIIHLLVFTCFSKTFTFSKKVLAARLLAMPTDSLAYTLLAFHCMLQSINL